MHIYCLLSVWLSLCIFNDYIDVHFVDRVPRAICQETMTKRHKQLEQHGTRKTRNTHNTEHDMSAIKQTLNITIF